MPNPFQGFGIATASFNWWCHPPEISLNQFFIQLAQNKDATVQSKFQRKTIVIMLIMAGLLTACPAPATPASAPTEPTTPAIAATTSVTQTATAGAYTITDATGTTLTFDGLPQRLICLFHECIELVSALGVEPLAVLAPNWHVHANIVCDPAHGTPSCLPYAVVQ